jgi:hypothetical protein
VIEDLSQLGTKAKPLASSLANALTNLQGQHGIENLLSVILFTAGSGNGFDDVSHYLRSFLYVGQCLKYVTQEDFFSCGATFLNNEKAPAAASAQSTAVPTSAATTQDTSATTGSDATSSADTGTGEQTGTAEPTQSQSATSSGQAPQSGLLGYLLGNGAAR